MSTAEEFVTLVKGLERHGLRFIRGSRGPSLIGDLESHRQSVLALQPYAKELEAFTLWRQLQDESEARFGHPIARLYPFMANPAGEFWRAPLIRTPHGPAHLVQVLGHIARAVTAAEVRQWHEEQELKEKAFPFGGKTLAVHPEDIWPPESPPPLGESHFAHGKRSRENILAKGPRETKK